MKSSSSRRRMALRRCNAAAAVMAIAAACLALMLVPAHRDVLLRPLTSAGPTLRIGELWALLAVAYAVLVSASLCRDPRPRACAPLRLAAALVRRARSPAAGAHRLSQRDRRAVLGTLLKGFFGPLMALSLIALCAGVWNNVQAMGASGTQIDDAIGWFDRYGFWLVLQALLLVDVTLFTLGYLIESRRLGNEIRSVDPSWLGWAAALACYPPLNMLTGAILGSQHEDFPRFADPTVHLLANGTLLVLMAVYAASSVALGLKASNLTHRGIVSRGPYAWVRHPAYTCKNMAWWIGSIPLVSQAFATGWLDGLMSACSVAGWTALYVLRALTEEDHLRSVDGDYATYARRVRFRFVPGVG